MATASLRAVTLGEVRKKIEALNPCYDALEWLSEHTDDILAFTLWKRAPIDNLEWLINRLDLAESLGYQSIYETQLEQASAAREAVTVPASKAYEQAVTASYSMTEYETRSEAQLAARKAYQTTVDRAWDVYYQRQTMIDDNYGKQLHSYAAYCAAYRALLKHIP